MRTRGSRFLRASGIIAGGAAALAYSSYRRDVEAARRRVATGKEVADLSCGSIEFAESGDGPVALLVHGAGGGFDQGLDLGRAFLGDGYRVVAPSRFGYLGTPLPADASAEAQAEAHLRLLDALQLETVAVIGVSAGAPSAMRLCLDHPERCSALVLVVPMAWAPGSPVEARSPFFETMLNTIAASDLLFWAASKVARMTLLRTILGTPVQDYRNATPAERHSVEAMLQGILPISLRAAGIRNDGLVSANLTRYELETMRVPTLVISATDDLYRTYENGFYTAEQIPEARFIGFHAGGHLLLGHDPEVRSQIRGFLADHQETRARAAMAL